MGASPGAESAPTFAWASPASRTVRRELRLAKATQSAVFCYRSPRCLRPGRSALKSLLLVLIPHLPGLTGSPPLHHRPSFLLAPSRTLCTSSIFTQSVTSWAHRSALALRFPVNGPVRRSFACHRRELPHSFLALRNNRNNPLCRRGTVIHIQPSLFDGHMDCPQCFTAASNAIMSAHVRMQGYL